MIAADPPSGALPARRDDLVVVSWQRWGRSPGVVVEHPVTGAVLELDERARFLLDQLDGRVTAGAVLARYRERFDCELPRADLDAFVRQLAKHGLLSGDPAPASRASLPEAFLFQNLIVMSVWRIGRGDHLLGWLAVRLRWLFSWPAHALVGALATLAGALAASHWLAPERPLLMAGADFVVIVLAVSWVALPSARAVAHGLACKRYGGQVPAIGVAFFYRLLPSVYCDWSDIAWHRDRAQRGWTIFAGIYVQSVIWAGATVAWWLSTPGSAWDVTWFGVALTAGVLLVTSTANPLMHQSAGYLLLVNWLDAPRLMERALAAVGAFLRGRPHPEVATARERRWLLMFGFVALAYSIVLWAIFLLLVGGQLIPAFGGAGAVGLLVLGLYLFQRPAGRVWARLRPARWGMAWDSPWRRWIWRGGVLLVVALLLLLPYPYETGGPFSVLPIQRSEVNCEIDGGRVTQVLVREGERVAAGQPLARIDPREYERNVTATEAQLEAAQAQLRLLRKELALLEKPPDIERVQGLEAETRRLAALLADYRRQLELTTLRAPIAGRVTTPLIEQSAGRYLKRGDQLATVEQAQAVQLEIHVPEADAPQVRVGAGVRAVPWAYPYETFQGTVKDIAPLALGQPGSGGSNRSVRVVAELANEDLRLKTHLTGFAKIRTERMPVWRVLSRVIARWVAVQVWYWLP